MRIANLEKTGIDNEGLTLINVTLEEVTPIRWNHVYNDATGCVELILHCDDECGIMTMEIDSWEFNIGDDENNKEFIMSRKDMEKMRGQIFDKVGQDLGCFI